MKAFAFLVVVVGCGSSPPRTPTTLQLTGAIQGQIVDTHSLEPLIGVRVTVTSPVLRGARSTVSGEHGFYKLEPLPYGEYVVRFQLGDLAITRNHVHVSSWKSTPLFVRLPVTSAGTPVSPPGGDSPVLGAPAPCAFAPSWNCL